MALLACCCRGERLLIHLANSYALNTVWWCSQCDWGNAGNFPFAFPGILSHAIFGLLRIDKEEVESGGMEEKILCHFFFALCFFFLRSVTDRPCSDCTTQIGTPARLTGFCFKGKRKKSFSFFAMFATHTLFLISINQQRHTLKTHTLAHSANWNKKQQTRALVICSVDKSYSSQWVSQSFTLSLKQTAVFQFSESCSQHWANIDLPLTFWDWMTNWLTDWVDQL